MPRKKKNVKNKQQNAPVPVRKAAHPPRTRRRLKGVAEDLGGAIGSSYGPVGNLLGKAAGRMFSDITGLGEYKVNRNELLTNTGPPVFGDGKDYVEICHREFIGDISATGASNADHFHRNDYLINPGNENIFPWLSTIANGFESWEPRGIIFEFKSTSATTGLGGAGLGTVIMATDYDVTNAPFLSKREMETYEYSVSTVPFKDAIHPVECSPSNNVLKHMYIRHDSDIKVDPSTGETQADPLYDLGRFSVATKGVIDFDDLGELWVSYKIRLYKQKHAINKYSYAKYNGLAPTTGNPFGLFTRMPGSHSHIHLNEGGVLGDVRFHLPGDYVIYYSASGSAMSPGGPTLVSGRWTQAAAGFWAITSSFAWSSGFGTGTALRAAAFRIDEADTVLNFTLTATSGVAMDFVVFRLPKMSVTNVALSASESIQKTVPFVSYPAEEGKASEEFVHIKN